MGAEGGMELKARCVPKLWNVLPKKSTFCDLKRTRQFNWNVIIFQFFSDKQAKMPGFSNRSIEVSPMVFRFYQFSWDFGNEPKGKGRSPWRPTNHFLNTSRPSLRKLLKPYTALIRHVGSDWTKKQSFFVALVNRLCGHIKQLDANCV